MVEAGGQDKINGMRSADVRHSSDIVLNAVVLCADENYNKLITLLITWQ